MRLLNLTRIITLFILTAFSTENSFGQEFKLDNNQSAVTVYGTSSLHDWDIKAESHTGHISFKDINTGQIDKLKVEILAESLKSGKRAMDKNTYKALNTKEFKKITFNATSAKVLSQISEGKYKAEVVGNLTISGKTNKVSLKFDIEIGNDNIELNGEKSIKMTDFNIDPPKALLGTITTGDDITIKFKSIFKK
ncbi:YceI family protein [Hwangdonia lutea]|uniref:YceI family protein n=1 Tax=Hwangdonia lutea TaxID=3075823 RepID=A0AA97EKW9_9FLAO|nr:YceI family protein [Hwangdonia sp. SCSIO 19198]WOD42485.1 YceI family protein [Hwangdonia sp. SCSIO 19198]